MQVGDLQSGDSETEDSHIHVNSGTLRRRSVRFEEYSSEEPLFQQFSVEGSPENPNKETEVPSTHKEPQKDEKSNEKGETDDDLFEISQDSGVSSKKLKAKSKSPVRYSSYRTIRLASRRIVPRGKRSFVSFT